MKRLYCDMLCIMLFMTVIVIGIDFLSTRGYTRDILAKLTDSEEYFVNNGPETVNPIIRKAQKEDDTTILLLGDSVAGQIFNGLAYYNEDVSILPCNAGVTIAGQYVIAKEYLEHHPNATDIYLFVIPESLGRSFDTQWGYQYAVLPFVETGTLGSFDQNTVQIMREIYGSIFINKTVATLVDQSGINRKLYLNYLRNRSRGYETQYFYELADQYIVKLNDLCKEKGVSLHLCPCPVSEAEKDKINMYASEYKKAVTYELFPEYYDELRFYPEECFGDGVHFSEQYRTREYLNSVIADVLDGTELLNVLQFE